MDHHRRLHTIKILIRNSSTTLLFFKIVPILLHRSGGDSRALRNALGHGNVTSEPLIVLLLQCHLQLFSYLQVCSGLKTSVVQHFRPPKSSKMSHPSSSIHEVERRVGVLLLSLNT
ncbi:hypothetical protein ISN44_As02g039350 [Arabidopsis suecica]|uniref:Uncharacterized protein n=1 Tax=Arabidopsis suecica TaxID=45249 RepID=A0A8T2G6F5_ARASU|nr:hypothetical protein ISN44_As02g039350 [Arabidopsis suecica]